MSVKTALVMVKKDCNLDIAEKLLMDANGFIRDVSINPTEIRLI